MSPDGTRCEQFESYAVVSTNKYIRGFHINSSDHSEAMVPVRGCMLDDLKHFFNLPCRGDIRNS